MKGRFSKISRSIPNGIFSADDGRLSRKRRELAEKLKKGERVSLTSEGKVSYSYGVTRDDLEQLSFALYKTADFFDNVMKNSENQDASVADIFRDEALRITLKLRYGDFLNINDYPSSYEAVAKSWQEISFVWMNCHFSFVSNSHETQSESRTLDVESFLSDYVDCDSDEYMEYIKKIYAESFPECDRFLTQLLQSKREVVSKKIGLAERLKLAEQLRKGQSIEIDTNLLD